MLVLGCFPRFGFTFTLDRCGKSLQAVFAHGVGGLTWGCSKSYRNHLGLLGWSSYSCACFQSLLAAVLL